VYLVVLVVFFGLLFLLIHQVSSTHRGLSVSITESSSQYPDVAKRLIEPWYEFEDTRLTGASYHELKIEILPDLPKREAVVAAFKVNHFYIIARDIVHHTFLLACMGGLW